jgi:hypothetical protein
MWPAEPHSLPACSTARNLCHRWPALHSPSWSDLGLGALLQGTPQAWSRWVVAWLPEAVLRHPSWSRWNSHIHSNKQVVIAFAPPSPRLVPAAFTAATCSSGWCVQTAIQPTFWPAARAATLHRSRRGRSTVQCVEMAPPPAVDACHVSADATVSPATEQQAKYCSTQAASQWLDGLHPHQLNRHNTRCTPHVHPIMCDCLICSQHRVPAQGMHSLPVRAAVPSLQPWNP